jgi:hypothetical protein
MHATCQLLCDDRPIYTTRARRLTAGAPARTDKRGIAAVQLARVEAGGLLVEPYSDAGISVEGGVCLHAHTISAQQQHRQHRSSGTKHACI